MTESQAILILEQASSLAALPKQGHVQVEQALDVLKKLIEKHKED
jgi:hypothetical protein